MLSIVFIISGIVWVIFTQDDNQYGDSVQLASLKAEQDEIFRQFYQLQKGYLKKGSIVTKQPAVVAKPAIAVPASSASANTPDLSTEHSVWDETAATPAAMPDFLRNNPWSPDYRPN